MNDQPPAASSGGIHRGLVVAALLFGVAAVIGAVAMMIFAMSSVTGNRAPSELALTSPEVAAPLPPTAAPPAPAPADSGGVAPAAPAAPVAQAPAMPGDGLSITPAAPEVKGDGPAVIDWSRYADPAAVKAAFSTNDGWAPGNDLAVLPSPSAGRLALEYIIMAQAPNDYVGMERDLAPTQDWRGYGQLVTTVQTADRSDRELVLQFTEASGEAWRHRVILKDLPADGQVIIPLTADQWEWADWSENRNKIMDLDKVNHIGLFIGHSGPGSGQLVLGPLQLNR